MVKASSLSSTHTAVKSTSTTGTTVKFLCSYGGKILPRPTDGQLRYFGGETRVVSVDRSISYSELMVKLAELCGSSVSLKCQLPYEDLDALVSITSDEDLVNLIDEYDRAAAVKIRAFLWQPKSLKKISPPSSATSSSAAVGSRFWTHHVADRRVHQPLRYVAGSKPRYYACHLPPAPQRNPSPIYFLHKGNHWQES